MSDTTNGSGSLLTLAIVGCLVMVTIVTMTAMRALAAKAHVEATADSVALAAADALSGFAVGDPCERAHHVAHVNETHLRSCVIEGAEVWVSVVVQYLVFEVAARAHAGPPL